MTNLNKILGGPVKLRRAALMSIERGTVELTEMYFISLQQAQLHLSDLDPNQWLFLGLVGLDVCGNFEIIQLNPDLGSIANEKN